MDRVTVYAGAIPLETDILKTGKNAMVGLAKLAAAVLGTGTITNGFAVTPTSPASLAVIVGAGEIYQLENLEASIWSSLPADTHSILKQGIILDPLTIGITPPSTVGYSQNFLVEVQYQDIDSGSLVLPYFDAANPALPFSGPGNAGTAQNTVRQGLAAVQIKAGTAATTGTQTTPTADAGWTGIYVVTVANGATTITSGNITQLTTFAPFINTTLPNVPTGVQTGAWSYGVDTGTVNSVVANLSPAPVSYLAGMEVRIKMATSPTGASVANFNGLGAVGIVKGGGATLNGGEWAIGDIVTLNYDGSHWQVAALPSGAVIKLTANKTIYVNPAIGSDANDGVSNTVGHALATIGAGIKLAFGYAPSAFAITIVVEPGTYPESVVTPYYVGPNIIIDGLAAASVIVSAPGGGHAFNAQGPNTMTVKNLTVQTTGGGCGFLASFGATITTVATASNAVGGPIFEGYQGGTITAGSHIVQGSCTGVFWGIFSGVVNISNAAAYTFSSPITVSSATAIATDNGFVVVNSSSPPTFTNPGNVTGPKYTASYNGIISASSLGVSFFPGTVAGTTSLGGIYAG